jgi:uncharacterized protein (TIGR03067 family)
MLLVALAVLLLGFAPAPFPRRDRQRPASFDQDLKILQGAWKGDAKSSDRTGLSFSAAIKGNQFTLTILGRRITWQLQPQGGSSPRALYIKNESGRVFLGIYRLEGDTLFICISTTGTRPSVFNANRKGYTLLTLKRIKSGPD